jgi:hypothetical protein
VSISMSPSKRQFHQFLPSNFSRVINNVLLSPSFSTLQKLSPGFIFLFHFPSTIGSFGLDLKVTLNEDI